MPIFFKGPRSLLCKIFSLCLLALPACAQQQVILTAKDGVKVYGAYYPAANKSGPIILLFHQAESNHWEYEPIARRVVTEGFSCLAIDQRSGDDMWNHKNETVAHLGRSTEYLDALPDLEAALAWAREQQANRGVILWGSSYSASLVFLLAAKHKDEISGLLAFSPGELIPHKSIVQDAAAELTIPVFVTSAKDQDEIDTAKAILGRVPDLQNRTQWIPQVAGVHGSSTLRTDRNPQGAAENWRAVLSFLQRFRR